MFDPTSTPIPSDAPARDPQGGAAEGGSERALARAALARYVAELLCEPDDDWRARVTDPAAVGEARQCAAVLGIRFPFASDASSAVPPLDDVLAERGRLFGHTVRSHCPPYELEYGHSEVFQQSQTLADVAGFYAAFGYQAGGPLAERPDHVVTQWEFLSLLAMKEAAAFVAGDSNGIECCRDAQRAFLRDHVAAWTPAFLARIRKAEPEGFFARVADLAEALLENGCADFGVPTGPTWLELRPVEEDDSTITCGADSAAQQVELGPTLAGAMASRGSDAS